MLLKEMGSRVGSRSAPIGTPVKPPICRQFEYLNLHSGWGPDWVLKYTPVLKW